MKSLKKKEVEQLLGAVKRVIEMNVLRPNLAIALSCIKPPKKKRERTLI